MALRFQLLIALVLLGGCDVAIKNGLFACGQPSDCPSGYFCWSSDNRCYDSKEPDCEPKSCERVIADFASVGITIECGSLPDGCDGQIECGSCPEGTICGANGQNFICGCEEVTCASAGAECGEVQTRCAGSPPVIQCNDCLGDGVVCNGNECVCPPGEDCDNACDGRCTGEEECVNGECCVPTYPCLQNECSPPGGLPNGCGGTSVCPPCQDGEECAFTDALRFECLGDCTCEAHDIECGNTTICGSPTPCGTCQDNGYGDGYRCESGRCTCEDQFEYNDTITTARLICGPEVGGWNCMQEAWSVSFQATLHSSDDVDYYRLDVMDANTPIMAQSYDGQWQRELRMAYVCPSGEPAMIGCQGEIEKVGGIEFCTSTEGVVGIERWCPTQSTSEVGTLVVGVLRDDYPGDCADYRLDIIATWGVELPY